MDKDTTKATEANTETIAPQEGASKVVTPTEDDLEAKNAALEAEKTRLIEEAANYKMAYFKEKSKKETYGDEEDIEEKIRRVSAETLAESQLAKINAEQNALIQRALKENKELKLAQLNKSTSSPASVGTHSEGTSVQDTLVTPDQMAAFKAKGWTDKDIERYKKNMQRYSVR